MFDFYPTLAEIKRSMFPDIEYVSVVNESKPFAALAFLVRCRGILSHFLVKIK